MTVFNVGRAIIARVEEVYGATYPARQIFPDLSDEILAEHAHWLAPDHYEAESGLIKLSVHSWLLQIGGKKILIDACCGNQKDKPGRPFWHMMNTPYLERLEAAGARPDEIDLVMCTHLHHDHVGWNTQRKDGRWVPTFPNARYVFSKQDFEHYWKIDCDPKEGPAELGTFRECVLPILEAGRADLVDGPHRLARPLRRDGLAGAPRPRRRPVRRPHRCDRERVRPALSLIKTGALEEAAGLSAMMSKDRGFGLTSHGRPSLTQTMASRVSTALRRRSRP
jgi:hypothetical protein